MSKGDLTGHTCGACNHYLRVLAELPHRIVEECPNCGTTYNHEKGEEE